MNIETAFIRTDASPSIGIGHAMRCSVLAEQLAAQGVRVVFAGSNFPGSLVDRIAGSGVVVHPMEEGLSQADDVLASLEASPCPNPDRVIVDHYGLGIEWEEAVRARCGRLMVLDDFPTRPHSCDILLDQNLGAAMRERGTVVPSECMQLLGPRYVLIRKGFLDARRERPEPVESARRVLVTLGGGNNRSAVDFVLGSLGRIRDVELAISVVVGPLDSAADHPVDSGRHSLAILQDVDDIASLMLENDVIISAAGSTCWESACTGIPMLLLQLADNQEVAAKGLVEGGYAASLGRYGASSAAAVSAIIENVLRDVALRGKMSRQGRDLIDGKGAGRAAQALEVGALSLREAARDDVELLFRWANDETVRKAAFASGSIEMKGHCRWLEEKLRSGGCRMYIATGDSGSPVGQVRFDLDGDEWKTDISIGREYRGLGLAGILLEKGMKALSASIGGKVKVCAEVKRWNRRSSGAFLRAGFRESVDDGTDECHVYKYADKG